MRSYDQQHAIIYCLSSYDSKLWHAVGARNRGVSGQDVCGSKLPRHRKNSSVFQNMMRKFRGTGSLLWFGALCLRK